MGSGGRGISRRAVLAGTVLGATAVSVVPAHALTAAGMGAPPKRRPAASVRSRAAGGHTLLARPLANPDGSNPLIQIRDVNRYGQVLGMIDAGESAMQRWPSAIWANGRVTVLPSPVAGASDCSATSLNDRGQAAGYYTVNGRTYATVWTGGVPRVLDIDTVYSRATALNNLGQVAVFGYDEPSGETATWSTVCLVGGTTVTTVSPPPSRSGMTFTARAVNDRGEVLMVGSLPQSSWHSAFLWRDGAVVADFTDVGGTWSLQGVGGLNARGDVVGDYYSPGPRAFRWSGGALTTFTGPGDGTASVSDLSIWRALNDAGDVVGYSSSSAGHRAFVWSGGGATDLGTLGGTRTDPVGINNNRQIAGGSQFADGSYRAFLWRAGEMIAITPPPGYATTAASAITEQGDVLGRATTADGSRSEYFRWTVG
jgi:probable HAF family extracellular repeat protein